jgi:hypothetical protein
MLICEGRSPGGDEMDEAVDSVVVLRPIRRMLDRQGRLTGRSKGPRADVD